MATWKDTYKEVQNKVKRMRYPGESYILAPDDGQFRIFSVTQGPYSPRLPLEQLNLWLDAWEMGYMTALKRMRR